eukprot:scaffold20484_cov92-Isochrysis_galbana.AAC.1
MPACLHACGNPPHPREGAHCPKVLAPCPFQRRARRCLRRGVKLHARASGPVCCGGMVVCCCVVRAPAFSVTRPRPRGPRRRRNAAHEQSGGGRLPAFLLTLPAPPPRRVLPSPPL